MKEYSEKELKKILDKVYEWSVEFSKSRYFEKLTEREKQESEFVITSFAEYMYVYYGLPPEKWNEKALEECCLYTLPKKVSADDSYFKSISPVLSAFFTFLDEKNLLKNALKLRRKIRKIKKRIISNAMDPRYWGPAKRVAMTLLDAGIDITDEEELKKGLRLLQQSMGPKEDKTRSKNMKRKKKKRSF